MITAQQAREVIQALGGKLYVASLDSIPESLRECFVANADGQTFRFEACEDLTALQNTVAATRRERDQAKTEAAGLKQKLGDLDPDKAREALATVASLSDKQVLDKEGMDALKLKHTQEASQQHAREAARLQQQIDAEKTRASEWEGRWKRDNLRFEIIAACGNRVNAENVEDVISRAGRVFQYDDHGNLVARKADGEIWPGADGVSSITPKQFVDKQLEDVPSFAVPSDGGGSRGNNGRASTQVDAHKLPPAERMRVGREQKRPAA